MKPKPPQKVRRRRHKWHLDESIWFPRKQTGNSRDYYENEAARRALFEVDWELAQQGHGLSNQVEKIDGQGKWVDNDNNGVHDSVDATREELWRHHELLYGVFDYYCAVFSSSRSESGEYDVHNMNQNAYAEFVRDCGLDAMCSMSQLMIVWTEVNAKEEKTSHLDVYNHLRLLNRQEFLQCIVRIAITLYLLPNGQEQQSNKMTVSAAVAQLCRSIQENAPPECHQDGNAFRKLRCYNEFTDLALRKCEGSLRRVFEVYSNQNRDLSDKLQATSMMSVGEWCDFVQHIGLFEMGQLSLFGAKIIFKWSIIRTARDHGVKSLMKLRNMYFEDFLEALVRVACVIALPTDLEVESAGAQDAGEFLLELVSGGELGELAAFVNERRIGWAHEPRQAVHKCVSHLLALITRTVERNTSRILNGKANMIIDGSEAEEFAKLRSRGGGLTKVTGRAGLLDGVRAAASIVRARLLEALQKVDILQGLEDERLQALADAMGDAPYVRDEYVFEQGDEGTAFFVIIEGRATVVRTDPDEVGNLIEHELKELSDGMFFGERALLKQQVRYAGVRVDSPQMHCVYITKGDFEHSMGCALEDLVEDRYKLDRTELLRKMHEVRLLGSLSNEQLGAMVDAMTEMQFPKGAAVFHEADEGDAFYVVLSGTAVARKHNDAGGFDEIGVMRQWSCFGERALVRDEVRYASVVAMSQELCCLRISREALEAALGAPPRDVLRETSYETPVGSPSPKKRGKKNKKGQQSPGRRPASPAAGAAGYMRGAQGGSRF